MTDPGYDVAARLTAEEAEVVLDCKRAYQRRAACVTHGEIHSRNIMIGPGALGVIDYGLRTSISR